MTEQLTGPALVAYLRDNPTSDAMQAAADEIERLRAALTTAREYVAEALAHERDAYKGFEHVSDIDQIERDLTDIDAALAAQPAASAEPREVDMNEYRAMVAAVEQIDPATLPGLTAAQRCALGRFAKPAGRHAGGAQPVAWVAADTLNSPHPTCVSSLAYMSQLDKDRGREYVPLYAALSGDNNG